MLHWSLSRWLAVAAMCTVTMAATAPLIWQRAASDWSEEDARQVLRASPWSKTFVAQLTQLQNEAARRESGDMGLPVGVGYDGIGDTRPRMDLPNGVLGHSNAEPNLRPMPKIAITVRWESALPIRVAEMKAREEGAPIASEDAYTIAVYGIPGVFSGDPEKLGKSVKGVAMLRRDGKKDLRPQKVEVFQLQTGATVVYTFRRSSLIGTDDGSVTFAAQIGRIVITQPFQLSEMTYAGKLEL